MFYIFVGFFMKVFFPLSKHFAKHEKSLSVYIDKIESDHISKL